MPLEERTGKFTDLQRPTIMSYLENMAQKAAPRFTTHLPISYPDWFEQHYNGIFPEEFRHKLLSCIRRVVEEAGKNGLWIKRKSEWVAIFRACADREVVGKDDYKGFCDLFSEAEKASFDPALRHESLKKAGADFSRPWRKWSKVYAASTKLIRMLYCAELMDKKLKENGFCPPSLP